MRQVGEIYEHECFCCHKPFQFAMQVQGPFTQPLILPEDSPIPTMQDMQVSHIKCPNCGIPFTMLGKFLFLLNDLEDFDEIEQHK